VQLGLYKQHDVHVGSSYLAVQATHTISHTYATLQRRQSSSTSFWLLLLTQSLHFLLVPPFFVLPVYCACHRSHTQRPHVQHIHNPLIKLSVDREPAAQSMRPNAAFPPKMRQLLAGSFLAVQTQRVWSN
jgi:hypothetical protein